MFVVKVIHGQGSANSDTYTIGSYKSLDAAKTKADSREYHDGWNKYVWVEDDEGIVVYDTDA